MEVIRSTVYQNTTFSLLSRFTVDGANGVQADASSITVKGWDTTDFDTTVLSVTPAASAVIFDTLQTDGRWTKDSTGYNWKYDVAETVVTTVGRRYWFEAVVTTSGGPIQLDPWEVLCVEGRSS